MRRATQLLVVGLLVALMAFRPVATPAAEARAAAGAPAWQFSTSTLVHGAGALLGIGIYRYLVVPLQPAPGVATSTAATVLTSSIAGAVLVGVSAVGAGFAYDRWAGQPLDYSYVWTRAGAVAGFGLASLAAGWVGVPATAATWSAGWFGYRLFLGLGAMAGSRAAGYWYDSAPPPAAAAQPPGG